jgi:hypothetical protein
LSTEEARALIAHFYKIFHGVEPQSLSPQKREIAQAQELIRIHGAARARYIVDFCHREAPKTNFQPQVFGSVLTYATRALADYEHHKSEEARQQREKTAQRARERREEKGRKQMEELLAQLSLEDRERFFQEVRAELIAKDPFVRKNPDGPMAQSLIRDAVLKKLKRQLV